VNTLRDGLHTLAGQAPVAAVPEEFFDRAHGQVRQRRTVRATAALVLVLTLVIGIGLPSSGGMDSAGQPGAGAAGLPSELRLPPLRTASAEDSPPGRAAMIFGGDATTDGWNEGRFAVLAAEHDRYRVFNDMPYTGPGSEALLSPDGSLIARNRTVRSLTGSGFSVDLPGDPRAFSPDGSLLVYETGEGTTTINGRERYESQVGVYSLTRRTVIASIDNSDLSLIAGLSVAVSPDNTRLALHLGDQVRLYRLDTAAPAPYATVPMTRELLAGPASWLPDGRSFVTARRAPDGAWQLIRRDAQTGEQSATWAVLQATTARYVRLLGWRPNGTAVATISLPAAGASPEMAAGADISPFYDDGTGHAQLIAISAGTITPDLLFETPPGVSDLDVAAQIAVAAITRTSQKPDYGPLPPLFLAAGGLLAFLTAALVVWLVRLARRRVGR
jgi:hypothetical protein